MEKHKFKPFDKVLVRDTEQGNWKVGIYSHYEEGSSMPYICIGSFYAQCIPYNENTVHLIGTNKPYEEPESKVWHVQGGNTDGISLFSGYCSDSELENFLKNDLLQKKYKWVRVEYNQ